MQKHTITILVLCYKQDSVKDRYQIANRPKFSPNTQKTKLSPTIPITQIHKHEFLQFYATIQQVQVCEEHLTSTVYATS